MGIVYEKRLIVLRCDSNSRGMRAVLTGCTIATLCFLRSCRIFARFNASILF
jgi:hypothetical protein